MTRCALLCLLPLAACHDDGDGATGPFFWHVDAVAGSDSGGDGSLAFPFRTISHAAQRAFDGDVIYVAPGSYSSVIGEVFPISTRNNVRIVGEAGSRGNGPPATIVTGGGPAIVGGGLFAGLAVNCAIALAPGNVIQGLIVTNPSGVGFLSDNVAATVEFCTITGNGSHGIQSFQSSMLTVRLNTIASNAGDGFRTQDSAGGTISLNELENNVGDAIQADDTSAPVCSTGNVIQGNGGVGIHNNTASSAISAANNIWIASTQGSSATGTYPAGVQPGPVAPAPGNNFAITAGSASLAF
jgi:hypothetical protein